MNNKTGNVLKAEKKPNFKLHDFLIGNYKIFLGLAVFMVLGAGYFFLLKPKYDSISALTSSGKQQESEYERLQGRLDQLLRLKRAYESIDKIDLEKVGEILPDAPLKDELLARIENMIKRNGLLLTSLQIEEVMPEKRTSRLDDTGTPGGVAKEKDELGNDVGKIKISMDIVGTDYMNLKRLLDVIENNTRLLDVSRLSFSPETNKTSLEILAYYLKKNVNTEKSK